MSSCVSSRVLVLTATERELRPVARLVNARFSNGRLANGRHVVCETIGVGKASAALHSYRLMQDEAVGLTILTGCAGAYPLGGAAVGDVVVATSEIFADEGVLCRQGFLDLRQLELPIARDSHGAPIFNEVPVVVPPLESLGNRSGADFTLRRGPIATVSTCSGTQERAREVHLRWQPLAETMEGAAVALAALARGRPRLPFVEIRGISNLAGDRDRSSWDIDRACANAAEVVLGLLESPVDWITEVGSRGPV